MATFHMADVVHLHICWVWGIQIPHPQPTESTAQGSAFPVFRFFCKVEPRASNPQCPLPLGQRERAAIPGAEWAGTGTTQQNPTRTQEQGAQPALGTGRGQSQWPANPKPSPHLGPHLAVEETVEHRHEEALGDRGTVRGLCKQGSPDPGCLQAPRPLGLC